MWQIISNGENEVDVAICEDGFVMEIPANLNDKAFDIIAEWLYCGAPVEEEFIFN